VLGAAAIIGWLALGPFAACTDTGCAVGTDHGAQDRRDENRRAQLHHPTGRSRTGGGIRCRPPAGDIAVTSSAAGTFAALIGGTRS